MSDKKNPTQGELNAAADKAEAKSADAASKAADPKATKSDKDAAASADADAKAARAAADEGPTYGTITVSFTGTFAPFGDTEKEFAHTGANTYEGATLAALAYISGAEAANIAVSTQYELDKREVAEYEARAKRMANVKAGKPATEPDPNAGKNSS